MGIGVSKRFLASLVGFGLAAVSMLTGTTAQAQTLAALPSGGMAAAIAGPARPIAAWTTYCAQSNDPCGFDTHEPATITLTPSVWQTLNAVNKRVNKSLVAITDMDHWGTADRWDLGEDGQGDCEDFQLRKRHLLAQAGLPKRAMRMTVVVDEKGEGHAVLTVITDRGDLILDNKTGVILPWRQTGYTFIKRESQETIGWVALGGAVSPTTTANR